MSTRRGACSSTGSTDPFTKHLLVEGLDDIGLTLQHTAAIAAYETHRPSWLPGHLREVIGAGVSVMRNHARLGPRSEQATRGRALVLQ